MSFINLFRYKEISKNKKYDWERKKQILDDSKVRIILNDILIFEPIHDL